MKKEKKKGREEKKKGKRDMRSKGEERIEVNSREKDRKERNKAVLEVEHQYVLPEHPAHARSSIIEGMPRALLLPAQSQCQQHYKYQDTLNRFFRDSFKANCDQ